MFVLIHYHVHAINFSPPMCFEITGYSTVDNRGDFHVYTFILELMRKALINFKQLFKNVLAMFHILVCTAALYNRKRFVQ